MLASLRKIGRYFGIEPLPPEAKAFERAGFTVRHAAKDTYAVYYVLAHTPHTS